MKLRVFLAVAVTVVTAFAAAEFGPGTARAQTRGPVVLTTQSSPYGSVLFTGDGKAVYMFTFDTAGTATSPAKSSCADKCAAAWPPLLAAGSDGPFTALGDVQAAGMGTIQRPDGTSQMTYFGWPLYTFVADKAAGQTNGENVGNFNGLWHLLSASGRPNAGVATVSTETTATGTALAAPTAFNSFRSLYMLTADPSNTSTCFGGCARFWPPLLTTGQPTAGSGADAAALGTARRSDGTLQVTYAGKPLYFFAPDVASGSKSGAANGEDSVDAFNQGIWYLLTPGGASEPGASIIGSKATDLGTILTYGPTSNPVYAFSGDRAGQSSCTGFCARIWTPVLTTGAPQASTDSGVAQDALGTIQRSDGTTQVTYRGQPLYTFSRDYTGNGGQGMMTFGGSFHLMLTSGTASAAMPSTRSVLAVPQLIASGTATSASFTVAFTSSAPGHGTVLFAPGATCSALVETATQDATGGGTTHMVTVTGNDMPGTVGDNGILPGTVYSYEVLTLSRSGQQVDNNAGKCYTVSIPRS